VDPIEPAGRRERHKARTREDLQRAARDLFARQGFAATTVQQITDAADVSERTFFRYFASKDDLLVLDVAALFAAVERAIRDRPLDEPPLVSILESLVAVTSSATAAPGGGAPFAGIGWRTPMGIDSSDPIVAGRLVRVFVDWEDRLAAVLLGRFTAAAPDRPRADLALAASVIARAAASAMRATLRDVREAPAGAGSQPPGITGRLREAFAILAGGCEGPVA
jgi:AcrR family transcriptional regulator